MSPSKSIDKGMLMDKITGKALFTQKFSNMNLNVLNTERNCEAIRQKK